MSETFEGENCFVLYSVYALASQNHGDAEDFNLPLPMQICDGINLENVRPLIRPGEFDGFRESRGSNFVENLEALEFALVGRYQVPSQLDLIGRQERPDLYHKRAQQRLANVAACLDLIRPMRVVNTEFRGRVQSDGRFEISRFAHPKEISEVPQNQKLFALRNCDARRLRALTEPFVQAMQSENWKFRMAVQFYSQAHLAQACLEWKSRFLLFMSAIEGIYTSTTKGNQGKGLASARIRWLLGADTNIYPAGEFPEFFPRPKPEITVGTIVGELYDVRNCVAHGERIPEEFFSERRPGLGGPVCSIDVLVDAASFIARKSLLSILKRSWVEHFQSAAAADAFFAANRLGPKDPRG